MNSLRKLLYLRKAILIGAVAVLLSPVIMAEANNGADTQLRVKPKKCVALRAGQICYATLEFYWTVLDQRRYCLLQEGDDEPISCWLGQGKGKHQHQFASDRSRLFLLQREGETVAKAEVTVAWVYKGRRRNSSSWRLF